MESQLGLSKISTSWASYFQGRRDLLLVSAGLYDTFYKHGFTGIGSYAKSSTTVI